MTTPVVNAATNQLSSTEQAFLIQACADFPAHAYDGFAPQYYYTSQAFEITVDESLPLGGNLSITTCTPAYGSNAGLIDTVLFVDYLDGCAAPTVPAPLPPSAGPTGMRRQLQQMQRQLQGGSGVTATCQGWSDDTDETLCPGVESGGTSSAVMVQGVTQRRFFAIVAPYADAPNASVTLDQKQYQLRVTYDAPPMVRIICYYIFRFLIAVENTGILYEAWTLTIVYSIFISESSITPCVPCFVSADAIAAGVTVAHAFGITCCVTVTCRDADASRDADAPTVHAATRVTVTFGDAVTVISTFVEPCFYSQRQCQRASIISSAIAHSPSFESDGKRQCQR